LIYSTTTGHGTPLVLLHGFCETHHIWDNLGSSISSFYRVITLDLPGFGDSDPLPENVKSIQQVADIVVEELERLGVKHALFVGHSLGGYVAIDIASRNQSMVKGLVLINSNIFADSPEKKLTRDKIIRFIKKHSAQRFIIQFIEDLFYDKKASLATYNNVKQMAMACTEASLVHYTQIMRDRPDNSEWITQGRLPTLVIAGRHDTIVPLTVSQEMIGMIPIGYGKVLDNCGHMAMCEKPNECHNSIVKFVSEYLEVNI